MSYRRQAGLLFAAVTVGGVLGGAALALAAARGVIHLGSVVAVSRWDHLVIGVLVVVVAAAASGVALRPGVSSR